MASDDAKRQLDEMIDRGLAEAVVYKHAGEEYSLSAIVDRGGMQEHMQEVTAELSVTLLVDDDPDVGVASPAVIDTGGDCVKVAERRGGTPAWRGVTAVRDSGDPDFVRLELA